MCSYCPRPLEIDKLEDYLTTCIEICIERNQQGSYLLFAEDDRSVKGETSSEKALAIHNYQRNEHRNPSNDVSIWFWHRNILSFSFKKYKLFIQWNFHKLSLFSRVCIE